ncbi:ABC-F family ATP-binding cassette domain-containing protein [Glycomyces xiaoerkulensis]|uniref:ABC-F family ATP-binding cassette domain-containing protein n=1 Tax=Glycomyces xiaoerkulensis TaxID=2038139 RepID=UPI000C2689CC|nr:ABC-F family ATP-binding cassette domain-containing protein [Glycomyces xiaoerkulensis]
MSTCITLNGLGFSWPDGERVLTDLNAAFSDGRTALIGDNGTGKSTLLKLIVGDLRPDTGTVTASGPIAHLPQELPLRLDDSVADLLGIAERRRALEAIESGDADEAHFAAIGDDWDVLERARATLGELGLDHIGLDRTVATLSGGESMLVGLAGRLLRRPDALLLDEPSNNLDGSARARLYEAIRRFQGTLLVVSHDRALLDRVDAVAELHRGRLRLFEGDYAAYERATAIEQEAAQRSVREAKAELKRQKREYTEMQTKLVRREHSGRKKYANAPAIVRNAKRNQGENTAGRLRTAMAEDVAEAREDLETAESALRDPDPISVDLPETAVSAHREIAVLRGLETAGFYGDGLDLHVRGPERIGLTGDNGSGKTTLLHAVAAAARVPHGFLTQRLEFLDDAATVLDNVRARAPETEMTLLRTRLARFLLRGEAVFHRVSTLSGGERLRVALAALLSARPAPRLLLLDEPTNNLDMTSTRQLRQALGAYRGALIVVSHDRAFLDGLGLTRRIGLERGKGITLDEPLDR